VHIWALGHVTVSTAIIHFYDLLSVDGYSDPSVKTSNPNPCLVQHLCMFKMWPFGVFLEMRNSWLQKSGLCWPYFHWLFVTWALYTHLYKRLVK
jgi:hypothetical protein